MNIGVILAAGKGSRLKSKTQNKTSLKLGGKPLVQYGADLFKATMDKTIVVVGAYAESVKEALDGYDIQFAEQTKRMGTGHAAKVAQRLIKSQNLSPTRVFIGYGDHMMFYTPDVIHQMESQHQKSQAAVTLLTVLYDEPDYLAWGRIIRNSDGTVAAIVEQKDATEEQRKIKEQNAGFYCFDYSFFQKSVNQLQKSKITGEYYITDLVEMAVKEGKSVVACQVPFELVGTGINTHEQLVHTNKMLGN